MAAEKLQPQADITLSHLAYTACLLMGELWKMSRRSSKVLLIPQHTLAVLRIMRAGSFFGNSIKWRLMSQA